ncbi:MAG: PQQ-binding-like beta-propeller repeat protein [Gemmatimonadales bacterium]|jgi:outer membrane protein assembly factor BamB
MIPRRNLWFLLSLAALSCSATDSFEQVAMFRGNAQHTGVYDTQDVDEKGTLLWRFSTEGPVRSSPTVLGDRVFIGSGDGHVYALDRSTGQRMWVFNAGSPINSTPAVARGLVVFGSRKGVFHAVDIASGRERWQFETGDVVPWEWGFEGWDAYTSSPVVIATTVVFGAGDGVLYALELATGTELWRFRTGGRIRSSPAYGEGVVFVGSADGRAYAVDVGSGTEVWHHETEGASLRSADFGFDRKSIIASPAVAGGTVFVGSRDGHMYALDQVTGERKWRADHSLSWAMSSPAVLGDRIYSGTSDGLFVHSLDVATGEELWRFDAAGYTWSSPAVVDGTVYIGDNGGYLRAIDRETGRERWNYRTTGGVLSTPVVHQGVVFFGSDDGNVYALTGETDPTHLAVFWDESLRDVNYYESHAVAREFFEQHGYETLDARALGAFMEARVDDGARSVIVFSMDHLPSSVAVEPSDTVLFRRYLDSGGKVVWLGLPPMLLERDEETGRVTGVDRARCSRLLGVDFEAMNFDSYGATATTIGREWGAPRWWLSSYAIDDQESVDVLGWDENGRASWWVRSYSGLPGTGFVYLGSSGTRFDELSAIRAIAEYGVARAEQ